MKKIKLYVLLSLLLIVFSANQVIVHAGYDKPFARSTGESAHPELWRDLVGAWVENLGNTGTVFDQSPFKSNGAITGATWTIGENGNAVTFTPTTEFIDLGNVVVGANVTIVIRAISTGDAVYNGNDGYIIGQKTDVGNFYFRRGTTADNVVELGIGDGFVADIDSDVDVWKTYVIVHHSDGVSFVYENGIQIATDTGSNFVAFTDDLYLGNRADLARSFDGSIDLTYIYNRAFSPSEVMENYISPLAMFELRPPVYKAPAAPAGGRRIRIISQYINQLINQKMLFLHN